MSSFSNVMIRAGLFVTLSSGLLLSSAVAAPVGFDTPADTVAGPQGFDTPTMISVKVLKSEAKDKAVVSLQGRFVERLEKDKYTFRDESGDTIVAELDDDKDWSHVSKNKLMTITAEVDRDWNSVEIEVIDAR